MDFLAPSIHRGITIHEHDVPGARFSWTHEETGSAGIARTAEEAIRQISGFLGPDPACRLCQGHGTEDWALLAYASCANCFPEDGA
ncbi:hypothetical protein [Paracoccus sulfuroxidans]|uniref:Uncharacterized protein n=1 Tax=Paracoccus sulfuroxidans TaxID=384678 RepID=A0A562NG42_9RHOB|nr:hypothetical protein [Paracoccus sulfuroxidans]TWI31096.1 hypothetical protein IQ24_03321 [Paracoccus sulfuroxidans]